MGATTFFDVYSRALKAVWHTRLFTVVLVNKNNRIFTEGRFYAQFEVGFTAG